MKRLALVILGVFLSIQGFADQDEVLTNKDVNAHKATGKSITFIAPNTRTSEGPVSDGADAEEGEDADAEPAEGAEEGAAVPEDEEEWEKRDREKDEARAAAAKREEEWNEEETAARAEEAEGFYRVDPENPSKKIWVDPEDEDFDSQLKDRRKERERERLAAEEAAEEAGAEAADEEGSIEVAEDEGESSEDAPSSEDDEEEMVEFINPRTNDVEVMSKDDPRYKKYLRDIRYQHTPVKVAPKKEDDAESEVDDEAAEAADVEEENVETEE